MIDIYYLKTDVVGELMTWLRKTGEAKLLIVAEGMRLQSSKAAHEEIRSIRTEPDEERRLCFDVV